MKPKPHTEFLTDAEAALWLMEQNAQPTDRCILLVQCFPRDVVARWCSVCQRFTAVVLEVEDMAVVGSPTGTALLTLRASNSFAPHLTVVEVRFTEYEGGVACRARTLTTSSVPRDPEEREIARIRSALSWAITARAEFPKRVTYGLTEAPRTVVRPEFSSAVFAQRMEMKW